jgi:hypothetical protein
MARRAGAAGSPVTWLLAAGFAAAIGAAVTSRPVLWRPSTFERTRDITRVVFAQTFVAAREIYAPPSDSRPVVALLGNSRVWLAGHAPFMQAEVDRLGAGVRVANLAIFGAGVGDLEVLSRHLDRLGPRAVVVTLDGADLLDTPAHPLAGLPSELLAIGWADGPLPSHGVTARLDRWGRTLWPLYRFREFARAALADRMAPAPPPPAFPHFADTRTLFGYMHGPQADAVEAAYQAWRRNPTFARFIAYLSIGSGGYLDIVRDRARHAMALRDDTPGVRVLDALLARLAASGHRASVLLMPQNPLLADDPTGEYAIPGFSDAAAAVIARVAAAHGVPVVDDRRALAPDAFIDFDHPLPELSGFQRELAREVVRVAS